MPRPVDHVDISDLIPFAAYQRRQKTMKTVEIRQRQEHLAPERFQAATGIAGTIAQDGAAHPVGDARLDFLESGVLASDPLTGGKADALATLFDRQNKLWQERWIVLAVAIERRHDGTARGANAAAYRRRLAGGCRVANLAQICPLPHGGSKPLRSRIS